MTKAELAKRIAQLEDENAKLRAALEPFGALWNRFSAKEQTCDGDLFDIEVRAFKNASEVLRRMQ